MVQHARGFDGQATHADGMATLPLYLSSATKILLCVDTDHCGSGQLMSMINFDNSVQVRAMGALLSILQQEMILDNSPDGDDDGSLTPLQIGEISQLSMY